MNDLFKKKNIEFKISLRAKHYDIVASISANILDEIAQIVGEDVVICLSQGDMTSKEFLNFAQKVQLLCAQFETTLIIKDRCDIAYLIDAKAILLDETSIDVVSAKKLLGSGVMILTTYQDEDSDFVYGQKK